MAYMKDDMRASATDPRENRPDGDVMESLRREKPWDVGRRLTCVLMAWRNHAGLDRSGHS